ncbi:MAG: bifunctional DNA-formamidopyrimidine glycosylase/DNA-(apurinic or apyrimidinic site) lyase [Geminicoccaceae bacterium]|nr:MAG: bifunctional DNA-formamidopyrimidine glycosylase/DNA-(apurinic or apyrimidinic site) lyase [Geminicoccaceae bacterium]
MPELPEVETTMRALERRLDGARIERLVQHRADLRFPLPAGLPERLQGRRLIGFRRRAKYILLDLDDGRTLVLHLGMSGRLVFDGAALGPHEHLTFTFDDGTVLRFHDPRRFGMAELLPTAELASHKWFRHLGLEPLGNAFSGPTLQAALAGRTTALKLALMDQRLVVGVGNIYASESLFRARLSPRRRAGWLQPRAADRLARAIRDVLSEAIEAGGSSLRDYVQADGELGNFQRQFRVYDRADEPCSCGRAAIRRIVQGGRATYYCPGCQR